MSSANLPFLKVANFQSLQSFGNEWQEPWQKGESVEEYRARLITTCGSDCKEEMSNTDKPQDYGDRVFGAAVESAMPGPLPPPIQFVHRTIGEQVNHPSHYISESGLEAIDVIESFGLNFNLGNAVKYLLRAGKKGDSNVDLEKAIWYIKREVEK